MNEFLDAADLAAHRIFWRTVKATLWLTMWAIFIYACWCLGMLIGHLMLPIFRAIFG